MLCLFPLLGINWFLVSDSYRTRVQDISAYESVLSNQIASSITTYVDSTIRGLENIAGNSVIVDHSDIDATTTLLGQSRAARPEFAGVFLFDTDGSLVAQAGSVDESVLTAVDSQVGGVLATGQRSVSGRIDLQIDPPTSVIVVMVPVMSTNDTAAVTAEAGLPTPITDSDSPGTVSESTSMTLAPEVQPPGTILGVVGAIIPTDSFAQSMLPSPRGQAEIVVLSGEQIIFATGDIREHEESWVQNLIDQDLSFTDEVAEEITFTNLVGEKRQAVFAPILMESADWSIIVTSPIPESQIAFMWEQLLALFLIAAFVYLVVSYVFGELMARSLTDLSESTQRLASGDYKTPIAKRGSGEMADLSSALVSLREQTEIIMTENEKVQRERLRQYEQLRDLLRRDLRMQEDERRHIASEIHDAVSPLITGALYQNRALQRANGDTTPEKLQASLTDVNELLERASRELHGIIFDLRPPDLDDIGVVAAIEAFVSTIQRTGLEARLEVIDEPPPLTPEVRLGIYRIVQEALHNVLRHAGADEAVVRLECVNQLLRITIRDNGAGFDPDQARRPTSLGLLSMRERAAAIGADFEIMSRPGGGTVIIVERRDTGSIMSDELLETILRDRSESEVEYSGDTEHNSSDERHNDGAPPD